MSSMWMGQRSYRFADHALLQCVCDCRGGR